ncbi:FMN-binding protein [Allorhodopirellula heiligendammensis]|uniref:Electron transport complex subunit RsxG n=1 Tax=Allorhodopirellula heiligendammensis TaxID=2714739 RepID=A0A5C6BX96_9BACT|nr:FMN-binding protein [Allorhodopirellula heiligendammensis]TWU15424.1 Electron transport complex subunit RsxG [Allorhodopirellula heiligendammensis]
MRLSDSARRILVHAVRVGLFATIILLVHSRFAVGTSHTARDPAIGIDDVARIMPDAAALGDVNEDGSRAVLNSDDGPLGYVLQTSPISDHIIGFSGPTNMLVAFGPDDSIVGVSILRSGDTREHLDEVRESPGFLSSFDGKSRSEVAGTVQVDAVSGATLTSLAISESIIHRLGGAKTSLRFPEPAEISELQSLFPDADHLQSGDRSDLTAVYAADQLAGYVLRSSPAADNIVGYQGPTDTFIGLNLDKHVNGFVVGQSYDNEPYVGYVREDDYFRRTFNELSLDELASADLQAMQVEGVSGATMTSLAVAEGIVAAAQTQLKSAQNARSPEQSSWLSIHDLGTGLVIVAAIIIGFTRLRANKRLRIAFQLILIVYLGWTVGNLLSQAMIAGWAKHGLPWRNAAGLVMLSIAAFACPIFTKRNLYCSHLCPHGAVQQLVKRRIGYQVSLNRTLTKLWKLIPGLLLLWCLVVVLAGLSFSLVDIEPFDAYLFPIAGWATIVVAIVGIVASLFIPMAYCRFGCPTGLLLEYLRYNAKSDRWTIRDWIATGYLALAVAICFL